MRHDLLSQSFREQVTPTSPLSSLTSELVRLPPCKGEETWTLTSSLLSSDIAVGGPIGTEVLSLGEPVGIDVLSVGEPVGIDVLSVGETLCGSEDAAVPIGINVLNTDITLGGSVVANDGPVVGAEVGVAVQAWISSSFIDGTVGDSETIPVPRGLGGIKAGEVDGVIPRIGFVIAAVGMKIVDEDVLGNVFAGASAVGARVRVWVVVEARVIGRGVEGATT